MSRRSFEVAASETSILFENFTKEFDKINERELQRNKRLSDDMEGQKQLIDNSIKRARQLREQGRNRELALAQEKLIQEQEQQHKAEDELIRLQKEAQDLEILVKNQEITKNIAIAKATASSTPSTTNGETNATGNELFPHALKCKKEVQSVERLLGDVARQNLSPMAQSVISVCTNTLQKTMSLLKSQSSSNTSLSDEVFAPLCKCVRDISKVINFTIRDDPKLLTKLALTLFDTIISSAVSPSTSQIPSEGVRDQCILAHTVIVLGFFKELSGNLASQLSVLFRGILYQKASLLLPVLSVSNSEKKSVNEPTVLAIKFFASLCSSHTMSTILSPLSAETGWQWLSCVHHEIKNNDTLINDSHTTIARMIIYFLSFAGSYLLSVYGIEFIKLLKNIHVTISTLIETGKLTNADVARDWKGLQGYLARVVADQFISARCLFGVEPHVVQGYFIKCHVDDLRIMAQRIDEINKEAGKSVRFSVRKAFNQLDVTVESAYGVVDSLLQYIAEAGSSEEMLGYTLDRIAMLLLERTRSINVTAEGHIAKLARVACELCSRQSQLTDLLKSQFYYACPLVFPGFPSSSVLDKPDMIRHEFGYVMKTITVKDNNKSSSSSKLAVTGESDGDQVWETDDDWMDRMGKMLAVFAEIVCSDNQTPFCIEDGWAWLAALVNSATTHPGVQPFFIAETLDIFLRVTGPTMMSRYHINFLKILKIIHLKIVPTLHDEGSRKVKNSIERLRNVLDGALKNKPPIFLSIINKS